jgi:lantibiotic modifying enzyme
VDPDGQTVTSVPFAHVLAPLAEAVVDAVASDPAVPRGHGPADLGATQIMRELSGLAAPTLYAVVERMGFDRIGYSSSVERLLDGALVDALDEYPMLAWLLAVRMESWWADLSEVLECWTRDRAAVAELLCIGDCGDLRSIVGLSEWHDGRRASLVRFDAGAVVYKPRSSETDEVVRLAAGAAGLDVRLPRHVSRAHWSWSLFVTPHPCCTRGELADFAHRAGVLLSLAHVLGLRDLHSENLIADGPHPVVVDCEALFAATAATVRPDVTACGLLPSPSGSSGPSPTDISGLGGSPSLDLAGPGFVNVNTDQMGRGRIVVSVRSEDHLPRYRGRLYPIRDRVPALLAGFAHGWTAIADQKRGIRDLLETSRSVEVRQVLRSTDDYLVRLRSGCEPASLRSPDAFARTVQNTADATSPPLAAVEVNALRRGEVPRFVSRAGERDLTCGDRTARDAIPISGLDAAVGRLETLTRANLARQTRVIHESLNGQARSPFE